MSWILYQVMQLFVGYVHLWGFAFMEGCIASVAWPYPVFGDFQITETFFRVFFLRFWCRKLFSLKHS